MKTKATTLLLTVLIFSASSYSQEYQKMLNKPSWIVEMISQGGTTDYLHIIKIGDTTIGNNDYLILGDTLNRIIALCREDSTERKVYKYEDSQEKLLFDFRLQMSDKITLSSGYEYTVHSIDSVSVRGGVRKRIYLTHSLQGNQTWIEGVGNIEHPLQQVNLIQDPHIFLLCSFKNGVNIFNYGIYSSGQDTSDCIPYSPNISAKNISLENYFKVYPNPATNILHIEFTSITPNKIEIQDIHGRTVYSQLVSPTQNTHEVSLADVSSGVYFVKLHSSEGVVLKKIIKN